MGNQTRAHFSSCTCDKNFHDLYPSHLQFAELTIFRRLRQTCAHHQRTFGFELRGLSCPVGQSVRAEVLAAITPISKWVSKTLCVNGRMSELGDLPVIVADNADISWNRLAQCLQRIEQPMAIRSLQQKYRRRWLCKLHEFHCLRIAGRGLPVARTNQCFIKQ